MTEQEPITFEQFRHMLAEELQIDESRLTPGASFVNDLAVDSIQLVEMMLSLEEKGISIPMEAAWDVQTVEDAYHVYLGLPRAGAKGDEPLPAG
jgi:acyl carrier protein